MKKPTKYNIIFKELNRIKKEAKTTEFECIEEEIAESEEIKNLCKIVSEVTEPHYITFTGT